MDLTATDFGSTDFFSTASSDMGGAGVLASNTPDSGLGNGFSFGVLSSDASNVDPSQIPYLNTSLFSPPVMAPDGVQLIDQKSNSSFWSFDQSKIPSSIQDVMGSIVTAGTKSAIQATAGAMNRNANGPTGPISGFFKNFQSTSTGAQLNAGAIGTQIQNFIANPIVWFGAIALVVLFFFLRK